MRRAESGLWAVNAGGWAAVPTTRCERVVVWGPRFKHHIPFCHSRRTVSGLIPTRPQALVCSRVAGNCPLPSPSRPPPSPSGSSPGTARGTMPFHSHHHTSSNTGQGAAHGIYQAAQALGAIGAPQSNLRVATSGTTGAGTDSLLPGSGNDPGFHGGGHTAPPSASGLPGPGASAAGAGSPYEAVRRPQVARGPEELHIPTAAGHQSASQTQLYNSPDQYHPPNLNISLQHATPQQPQDAHFANPPPPSSSLPAPLQPGPGAAPRPGPSSSYTAPTTVPKINTNAQQYTLPTRSSTMNSSQSSAHSYSRSSPAGMDQKYIPFNSTNPTPEMPKYAPTPSQRHFHAQTPSGAASHSPLALSDIRPRANSTIGEEHNQGATMLGDFEGRSAGNSNYLAPWPIYAYDWCKWPVNGNNSAGKMAIGSYLEDPHNFVSIALSFPSASPGRTARSGFKTQTSAT